MPWNIALLNKVMLEVMNSRTDVLLQNFVVESCIMGNCAGPNVFHPNVFLKSCLSLNGEHIF